MTTEENIRAAAKAYIDRAIAVNDRIGKHAVPIEEYTKAVDKAADVAYCVVLAGEAADQ